MEAIPENGPYIIAYWGGRTRTPEQVARAVLGTLHDLSRLDVLLGDWRTVDGVPVERDVRALADHLEHCPAYDSDPGGSWATTFSSSGTDLDGYLLSFCDGTLKEQPVTLNLLEIMPKPSHGGPDALRAHAAAIVEAVVRHWRPDSAAQEDLAIAGELPPVGRRTPRLGRVTWLAGHLGAVSLDLPEQLPGLEVRTLQGGTLLELQPPEWDEGPFVHDQAARLAELLEDAGLLRDIPLTQRE